MKSLKITLVAIFSIFSLVLLTGVNSSDDIVTVKEETNKEIKTPEVKLIVMTELEKKKKPSNG